MRAILVKAPDRTSPFFTARHRFDRSLPFVWHFHREFELAFIISSRGRRFVGDHIDTYGPGDLLLLGPYLPHTYCSDADIAAPHECMVVHFSPEALFPNQDAFAHPGMAPLRHLFERARNGLRFPAAGSGDLQRRLKALPGLSPLAQLASFLTILETLTTADSRPLSSRSFDESAFGHDLRPIDRVCRFLNEHYRRSLSLSEAAAEAGMSESAFTRLFRRSTGKTLTAYINDLRLAHACRLLLETDHTIAAIAEASGFPQVPYFNRRFLRAKGMRPAEYRKLGHDAATNRPTG